MLKVFADDSFKLAKYHSVSRDYCHSPRILQQRDTNCARIYLTVCSSAALFGAIFRMRCVPRRAASIIIWSTCTQRHLALLAANSGGDDDGNDNDETPRRSLAADDAVGCSALNLTSVFVWLSGGCRVAAHFTCLSRC
jgi:hypothetical protein